MPSRFSPLRLTRSCSASSSASRLALPGDDLVFRKNTSNPAISALISLRRFATVFWLPGVELGVTDAVWSLIVRTTCRHLKQDRCTIFGRPERPLVCKYYDAWKCTYRVHFGLPRPPGFVRVRLEEFGWLTE